MNNFKKITWSILLGLAGSIALAAAGDRFIANPENNKNIVVQVNKGGTKKDIITADGTTGGVTVGTSASNNYQGPMNYISGGITSANQGAGNQSGLIMIGANANYLNAFTGLKGRTNSTQGGNAITFDSYLDTAPGIRFLSNIQGQSTTTDATENGSMTPQGLWTLGPTNSTSNQTINGVLKVSSTGLTNGSTTGTYTLNPAANQTCNTTCGVEPSGFNASSGACLMSWTSGGSPQACTVAASNNFCYCAAIP